MKKSILLIISCIFLFSCVSNKEFRSKELEVASLQKQLDSISKNGLLDSDSDGIIDKYDACPNLKGEVSAYGCSDRDGDGVPDAVDNCPDHPGAKEDNGCNVAMMKNPLPNYVTYFQKLNPTKTIHLTPYFKKGIPLKQLNSQLISVVEKKLKRETGNYKYFDVGNGNYAIITRKECITKDGKAINTEQCKPDKDCSWFQFSCVEEGYSRFYLFLITKKVLGENPAGFDLEEFSRIYETDALDSNWKSIPELSKLLSNPENKFTDEYSVIVKLFEIKKEGQMGDAEVLEDPTYEFEKQIKNSFKPNTPQ
ncbi:thrombospondin type 3 repeat-containing protein [Flavobacterium sp. LHD-80]|uniref:thrombospondin type 3 repeat-containing protein n=1 Tax=Flavobacterium sp. LHD-80 TaxID=3071411 RepID=UPI0027E00676|nr:thrombospondin type 3 repeat-containing protein [Flavobacterium sp. LHD-80]MDQ6472131.1 thrombospondin type 3 repeat-containing protein [Flavobacterium sp. LHD-80]